MSFSGPHSTEGPQRAARMIRCCRAAGVLAAVTGCLLAGGIESPVPAPAMTPPPAATPIPTAAPLGRFPVGVRVQTSDVDGHPVRTTTWYPALHTDAAPYVTPAGIEGTAVQDAPADRSGGPYPLIVFSPGVAAPGDGYYFYTQNLASEGYVVVGIDHDDATGADVEIGPQLLRGATATLANDADIMPLEMFGDWFRDTQFGLTYRPGQITFTIDQALRDNDDSASPLHGLIDPTEIGMTGHSLGAWDTLLEGGMSIPCDHPRDAVHDDWQHSDIADVDPCAMPEVQSHPDGFRDPRITAILPLAPPIFNRVDMDRAGSTIGVPMMLLTGDDPHSESTQQPQRTVYAGAQVPKYFVEINGTDHFLVSDFTLDPNVTLGPVPLRQPQDYADFAGKANVYMTYSAAFFDRYLKGDPSGLNALRDNPIGEVAESRFDD